jgi:CheY-like chemotaxis protein
MSAQVVKALVVDDEPIARKTIAFALEQEGFRCVCVSDGNKALERMAAEQFDLVVTDICMPNTHGHALVVEVLSRADSPVIAVHTSLDNATLTKDLMSRGVAYILTKPGNYTEFAAQMMSLVQRRKTTTKAGGSTVANGFHGQDIVAIEHDAPCAISPIGRTSHERGLANVQHLSPPSTVPYDVYVLSNCEETTTQMLARALLRDATLTNDVLRLANSTVYTRNGRLTIDVEVAVVRIGFKKVGEIALD